MSWQWFSIGWWLLLLNNGGETLITILPELILCTVTHKGRRRGEKKKSPMRLRPPRCELITFPPKVLGKKKPKRAGGAAGGRRPARLTLPTDAIWIRGKFLWSSCWTCSALFEVGSAAAAPPLTIDFCIRGGLGSIWGILLKRTSLWSRRSTKVERRLVSFWLLFPTNRNSW